MTQYLVTTEKGIIKTSEPSLPIYDVDIQYVNDNAVEGLYRSLQAKIPNLVHCEVVGIDWDNDIVQHILVQVA